jgi:hypothetical protein
MALGHLEEALRAAAFVCFCAALLWWLVNLVVKDSRKSAIIVSALAMLFFGYGHALVLVTQLLDRMQLLDRTRFLVEGTSGSILWLASWAALCIAVLAVIVRQRTALRTITAFLNVTAVASVLVLGVRFASGVENLLVKSRFQDWWEERDSLESTGPIPEQMPDIYYIIVDAYARADILQEVYGLDNSEFLSYLVDRGFYVAERSRSNYAQSSLSIASSLNFRYLDDLEHLDATMASRAPFEIMIQDNELFRFLRQHGYSIVSFSTGYEYTQMAQADIYLTPFKGWSPGEFEEAIVKLTPISGFSKTWAGFRRERIRYAFEHIADGAQAGGPTFVFVHVLAPHWPFIFDAEGNPIQPIGFGQHTPVHYQELISSYSDQLLYINKMLKAAIDSILSQSSMPPIIVLQADHGPDLEMNSEGNVLSDFAAERMSILNALYFPDQAYEDLYEEITPVNTFRVILNNYFGTDLALLEDRVLYSSYALPYQFTEVTSETEN